jgi:hypothetical protein
VTGVSVLVAVGLRVHPPTAAPAAVVGTTPTAATSTSTSARTSLASSAATTAAAVFPPRIHAHAVADVPCAGPATVDLDDLGLLGRPELIRAVIRVDTCM